MHHKPIVIGLTAIAAVAVMAAAAFAIGVPEAVNFQGTLAENGTPVDGPVNITFELLNESDSVVWTETHAAVQVNGGLFTVTLGQFVPIPDSVSYSQEIANLVITVDGEVVDTTALVAVPYAMHARVSDYVIEPFDQAVLYRDSLFICTFMDLCSTLVANIEQDYLANDPNTADGNLELAVNTSCSLFVVGIHSLYQDPASYLDPETETFMIELYDSLGSWVFAEFGEYGDSVKFAQLTGNTARLQYYRDGLRFHGWPNIGKIIKKAAKSVKKGFETIKKPVEKAGKAIWKNREKIKDWGLFIGEKAVEDIPGVGQAYTKGRAIGDKALKEIPK